MKHFAMFGAGFWARYQLAAWGELPGATCVAICDPDGKKAAAMAADFGVAKSYTDPNALFAAEKVDFIDIVSAVPSHAPLSLAAAERGIPTICQKPMAEDMATCEKMVAAFDRAAVPFFIHENFRWQTPIQAVKNVIARGDLGRVYRARIDFVTGFDVFKNQPALRDMAQLIVADLGIHLLDVARFLFGEARDLRAHVHSITPGIKGEDVASVLMRMAPKGQGPENFASVTCNMAYAGTPIAGETFPQPTLFLEGTAGSLILGAGGELRVTTRAGTEVSRHAPPPYAWANPDYLIAHASMVPCNDSFLRTLQGEAVAVTGATTGQDNLATLRLVHGSYESAHSGQTVSFA